MKTEKWTKESLKQEIIKCLKFEKEVKKIIIFGSFLNSENPNDIDIAVFQDSEKTYLTLAMKYRKLTRNIARHIPIDIIPIKSNASENSFLAEIESGELVYEK
ncbi:MAG: nucleotidyltransferase domain-containing protein [bacterium]